MLARDSLETTNQVSQEFTAHMRKYVITAVIILSLLVVIVIVSNAVISPGYLADLRNIIALVAGTAALIGALSGATKDLAVFFSDLRRIDDYDQQVEHIYEKHLSKVNARTKKEDIYERADKIYVEMVNLNLLRHKFRAGSKDDRGLFLIAGRLSDSVDNKHVQGRAAEEIKIEIEKYMQKKYQSIYRAYFPLDLGVTDAISVVERGAGAFGGIRSLNRKRGYINSDDVDTIGAYYLAEWILSNVNLGDDCAQKGILKLQGDESEKDKHDAISALAKLITQKALSTK